MASAIHYPSNVTALELVTRKDGLAASTLHWDPGRGDPVPSEYTLRLIRAAHIGGVVRAPDGSPAAGVKVEFMLHLGGSDTLLAHDYLGVKHLLTEADAEGRWRLDRIAPRMLRLVEARAYQPDHGYSDFERFDSAEAQEQLRKDAFVFKSNPPPKLLIDIDDGVVVVIVEERSVIAAIDFVGLKEFDMDTLVKSLKDFGIGEGLPFDKALADRAEQELKRQYLTRSLYGAEVVTTVTPQERNRVNVVFTVTEGTAAKIRELRIVGNKAFSEGTLKGLFDLNDGGWLNWYTKADRYSRSKLNADLETLRAYYLNRGYLEFNVDSTQVAISPDKQDIGVAEGQ